MGAPAIDIAKLTLDERLRLIDELWESLRATPDVVRLTPQQKDELDRRLDELDRGDVALVPWDEVRRRLGADVE